MLARANDPYTSQRAAREVVNDGTAASMERKALRMIKDFPGLTANELEARANLKDGQLRKRLATLRKKGLVAKGLVRRSNITGKQNSTWSLTDLGRTHG